MSDPQPEKPETASAAPGKTLPAVLVLLGLAAAGWAFFLWWQLFRSRSGLDPVCIGGGGCAALWDGDLASSVHRWTGLPVAAWGVVWGAVAAFLPLQAMGQENEAGARWRTGARWVGLAGLLGVVGLLGASAMAGSFCGSCAVTYALTLTYGVMAVGFLGPKTFNAQGLTVAMVAVIAAWLLFLYPGLRTPKNVFGESREAFQDAAGTEEETRVADPVHTDKSMVPSDSPLKVTAWPLSPEEQTRRMTTRLADAPPQWQSVFHGMIQRHRTSPTVAAPPATRHLHGEQDSTVRITVFTDTLCGHCAQLHADLTVMEELFPAGAFAVESRHFPLDGNCNPFLGPREDSLSCPAAKARICLEDSPQAWDLEMALYRIQQGLTEDSLFNTLAGAKSRADLEACMASEDTARKLKEDVEYAMTFEPRGTPIVLVDGRVWTQDAMMTYLLLLAEGNSDHPAFKNLPPPPPASDLEHHGHNH